MELDYLSKQLESLNPKAVLARGYSISVDEKGKSIKSVKGLSKDSVIRTILQDGEVSSKVIEIKKE